MVERSVGTKAISYVLLVLGLVIVLVPFYLTVVTAMKTQQESTLNFFSFPDRLNFDNFREVIERAGYWTYVRNSTVISSVSVVFILLLVPMASYSIARNPGRKYYTALYFFIILGIFIPFQVIMLPLSVFMSRLQLNNHTGVIIFYIGVSFMRGVFLFTGYIKKNVPIEIEESAFMDGASVSQSYFRLVLPVIAPMVSALLIIDFLWVWNDFMVPLIILNRSPGSWTLPLFQYNFKTQYTFQYNLAFASYLMAMIPVIIAYVFAQKYIIAGLTAGSLKG